MVFENNSFISGDGLLYAGVLRDVKKSKQALQPVFEAFTNAIEAIKDKKEPDYKGFIKIKITTVGAIDGSNQLKSIQIQDNGVGFNDDQFRRFNTYKDYTKGYKNLGSGRIQYAHHFDSTTIDSTYQNDNVFYKRKFIVSKAKEFLKHNSITKHVETIVAAENKTLTKILFSDLLDHSNIYNNLTAESLKEILLERYIEYFCDNKKSLPKIVIEYYDWEDLKGQSTIESSDIPEIDKTEILTLHYSKLSDNGLEIVKSEKSEVFTIKSFKLDKKILKKNDLKFTSKNEIVDNTPIALKFISKDETVKDNRYLFLISSNYIDDRDTNVRGEIAIPSREAFSKNSDLFTPEEILLEDINDSVNTALAGMYPEIKEIQIKHQQSFEKLKEMFLLDNESADELAISINDSENKILEKFYTLEAKKTANIDANIKKRIDRLDCLDTTSPNYEKLLQEEVNELVKEIPIQNRTTLTHYVGRRKIVLELFAKILGKQLNIQDTTPRNIDEKLLHNLIFQQTNIDSEKSDLWLVNEDFIYFKGSSEKLIKDIKINDIQVIRDDLTPAEAEFRKSLNEDRFLKRPDILLFPDEGKCIIIEFKNPEVNVSDHLNQMNNYATLLRNFSKPEFEFTTFYGYLIGEKINSMDVRSYDADFKEAFHFDYMFRANKVIAGLFGKSDASIYTEVIKYTTLLDRAKRRNDIFIEKLTNSVI